MRFYLQLDSEQRIRDCITYPYDGYEPVEIETPLPIGLLGGWYRWDGTKPVYDRELYEQVNEISLLQEAAAEKLLNYLEGLGGAENGDH